MNYVKYVALKAVSLVTGNSVVNVFGATYLVAGNLVIRIR